MNCIRHYYMPYLSVFNVISWIESVHHCNANNYLGLEIFLLKKMLFFSDYFLKLLPEDYDRVQEFLVHIMEEHN